LSRRDAFPRQRGAPNCSRRNLGEQLAARKQELKDQAEREGLPPARMAALSNVED
jgi:hypothetical protein